MAEETSVRELYVYSTPTYEEKGWLKIGDASVGRVEERIREQQGTSNPEEVIILFSEKLPVGKRDYDVHKILLEKGVKRKVEGAGREWFETTVEEVQKAFNLLKYGCGRIQSFPMRKEQAAAVEKALRWFRHEYDEHVVDGASNPHRFLLNAKMRFGKCFTGMHLAKAYGATNTLIVTYKPEVMSEWIDTVMEHVQFEGWIAVRAKKFKERAADHHLLMDGKLPGTDGPLVLCVSLQDLSIDEHGKAKKRLDEAIKCKWDLIIFDEVHFGSRTERARYIIDQLKWKKRLDLSGTPFRLIQFEDFCPEQVFTYSYLDEQANKRDEIATARALDPKIYRVMPDLDISTIEITEEDIKQQTNSFLTDDLDFSLNELFKATAKGFNHSDAVEHFMEGLCKRDFDARAISVFGKLGDNLGVPVKRHTVWWLNRVASVKALSKMLKRHPYFKDFEIINAAGTSDNADISEEQIAKDKSHIQSVISRVNSEAGKRGTITLTVKRFLTGVTIKEWDSILVLNDVKSAESYFQAIFRVQSAWVDRASKKVLKPKSWVFDFAISRCLRTTYEYADALADQLDTIEQKEGGLIANIDPVLEGLCDTLNIRRFYEGSLKSSKTVAKDIFEALNETGSRVALAKRITSDALLDFASLTQFENNPALFEALKKIKGYRTQEVGGIEDFIKIGKDADELKRKKSQPKDDEDIAEENKQFEEDGDKEIKSKKKWVATQIKRLAICMADFIYMTQFREHKIGHVINTKDPEFFEVVTGITKDEFNALCDVGLINKAALNRIVNDFRRQEESSLRPEEFILKQLLKLKGAVEAA